MVFASVEGDLASVVYWSAPLPKNEDLQGLVASIARAPTGGMMDIVAPVSVCPEETKAFAGHPGMIATDKDGRRVRPSFRCVEADESSAHLRLDFRDDGTGIDYRLEAEADAETNVITLKARLTTEDNLPIDWLAAPVLPGAQPADHLLTFSGRWCGEFQTNTVAWAQGAHVAEAPGGRTSHEWSPGVILPTFGATENAGEAYGLHLGWSGGHRLVAEELPSGLRQVQFGASGETVADDNGEFVSPPLFVTRSADGLNGVSQAFHSHVRRRLVKFADPERPRPVHYNCWEAVYFDHQPDVLKDLASRAADLGAERFVLDDGWFGRRDDDTSSLGDWTIDRRKWPDGLTPLIDHVKSLGMTFGIWFEPEMVNPDSDLFRAHPDWVLGPTDQPTGRGQLVLDLTVPGVTEYLFDAIATILRDNDIEYIKWDHNRVLPLASQQQTEALYGLLDKIQKEFQHVEIETCASGGGRIDFGILSRTQRFWTSDSNDAYERWKIQRGTSYFFPPEITGSHIGPRICHTSGRQFPMSFRASVAGTRAMGLEMDLRELTDVEADEIRRSIASFKKRRMILHSGRLFRLESCDPEVMAEMHVAEGGDRFLLFSAQMQPSRQQLARPLRLAGLEDGATYRVVLENAGGVVEVMNRGTRNPLVAGEAITVSGAALMHLGLQLPNAFPNTIWQVAGERL